MSHRLHSILPAAMFLAIAASCGPRPTGTPASQTLVVTLADDDGATGRVSVSNPSGTVELRDERDSTRIAGASRPAPPAVMDEPTVQKIFGAILNDLPPPAARFNLYFQLDSDQLTEPSRALIPDVVRAVSERPVPDVSVIGHTDTSGAAAANYDLGLRRASAIRAVVISSGVKEDLVEIVSFGEADLLVATPDDTMEPRNRRVEITVR
jgi:outer membrane protein OmpA-like peptidoglycan-associated protein